MKMCVKIIGGSECTLEVNALDSILQVKGRLQRQLSIPVDQQKLVYKGRTLTDESYIKEYGFPNNVKVFLAVKKETLATSNTYGQEILQLLKKHYTEQQSISIIEQMQKDFRKTIQTLSLDDIERISSYLNSSTKAKST